MKSLRAAPSARENSAIRVSLSNGSRWLRHLPERMVHASRRKKAILSVAAGPPPGKVLYICLGNICRSPYAEAASRRDAAQWHCPAPVWHSAGLIGAGRPSPPLAIDVAAARGAPLDAHQSRVVMRDHIVDSDLIVVMEAYQAEELAVRFGRRRGVVVLGDFDPEPIETRTILDPWNRPREEFVASYERIDRCLAVLAESVCRTGLR